MDQPQAEDRPYPPVLAAGTKIMYTGPEYVRLLVHLTIEHLGVVSDAAEKHADMRWVDKEDWFVEEGIFDPRWLSVVGDRNFTDRARDLRASAWPGFSAEAPGRRRI